MGELKDKKIWRWEDWVPVGSYAHLYKIGRLANGPCRSGCTSSHHCSFYYGINRFQVLAQLGYKHHHHEIFPIIRVIQFLLYQSFRLGKKIRSYKEIRFKFVGINSFTQ